MRLFTVFWRVLLPICSRIVPNFEIGSGPKALLDRAIPRIFVEVFEIGDYRDKESRRSEITPGSNEVALWNLLTVTSTGHPPSPTESKA